MEDSNVALYIGLMAGSIFFIDGWGPTEKNEKGEAVDFLLSKRFRGLSVLVAGGIITPVLDYVSKNAKPEFFLAYLRGCIYGWFFVMLFGLLLYLFWIVTKQKKINHKGKISLWYQAGEFAYSILDFIYLGISDNPHLNAKRKSDVKLASEIYDIQNTFVLDETKKIYKIPADATAPAANALPTESIESTKNIIKLNEEQDLNNKTEADFTFNDWYYRGIAAFDGKEYEKAVVYMKNALEKDDKALNAPDAYLYMGLSYANIELYRKGIEQYDKIISDYSQYTYLYLVYYDKGVILDSMNLREEALVEYEKAIKEKPDYALAWYNKGVGLYDLGRTPDALTAYEEAIRLDPGYADSWNNKGVSLNKLERHAEALKAYEEAIRLKPDYIAAWNNKGLSLNKLGKPEEALKAYEQSIKLKSDDYQSWFGKAFNLAELNRYDEALTAYQEAMKLSPGIAAIWYNTAGIYAHNKNKEQMLFHLKRAIELENSNKTLAKNATGFKAFWNDEDFKKLVA